MDSKKDKYFESNKQEAPSEPEKYNRSMSGPDEMTRKETGSEANISQQTLGRNDWPKTSRLTHSVSIFVEPCLDEAKESPDDPNDPNNTSLPPPDLGNLPRRHSAGPILLVEESEPLAFREVKREDREFVESIMAHARLRKEEFARLLEEHAQIVSEISRAETKLL